MKLTVFMVITILQIISAFDVRCPVSSEWILRANLKCGNRTKYVCLYNDFNLVYSESCDRTYVVRAGRKNVRSPGISNVDCPPQRYQPFIFTTDGNSDCVYGKSPCSEEGQVVASNGTTTEDVGCRCDYTKGYTYTSTPENVYSCIPSKEDCSCYIKQCASDQKLKADYICVDKSSVSFPAIMSSPSNGIGKTTSSAEWLTDNISKTRTSAGDAAVGIIVIVLIYVVLLLVLFVEVRPYLIITDLQYREDLIFDKCDESFKYTLVPGDNLTIEWEVESRLPVKLIIVQKDKKNVQLNKKYMLTTSKDKRKLSFTINQFEPNDAGMYTCIATNGLGLSNSCIDRYVNRLLKMETGLDFRKCLMNFPICRLAVINPFQINVTNLAQETQDIVLTKGEHIKLEVNCSQNIVIIKWFICVNNNTAALPLKDRPDKYSGGTITEPSLVIHSSQMKDAGLYICVVKCANNDILTFAFYLQDKMYEEIRHHREDKLYVKTSTVDKAYQCLSTHGMVVLNGRKGTGKTKMCLELASLCEKADFQPVRVELLQGDIKNLNTKKLYIMDNVRFEAQDPDKLKKIMPSLSYHKHQWIVITCRSLNVASLKDVLKDSDIFKEECILDLNNSLKDEEKSVILRTYFEGNNIIVTSLQESNNRSKDILSENIPVKVASGTTETIVKSNPYYGFPLTVVEFCGNRARLHIGERYFTNPPKKILEKVKKIYENGRKRNEAQIHQYCILVHIAIYEHLTFDNFNVSAYKKTAKELFGMDFGTDVRDIQNAVDSMCGLFVECQANKYKFIHSCTAKAVFMSSDYCAENYLIINGSFHDTKDCVRSYQYEPVEHESVYKLTFDHKSIYRELCNRLILESCENIELSKEIYLYMYTEFIQLRDTTFVKFLIEELDKLNSKGTLPVWQIITMLDDITNYGTDPWIYSNTDSNEMLQKYPYVKCGLIAACKSEYLNPGAKNLWTSLISIFEKCLKDPTFVESLGNSLDINGNTFFHYLTLFSEAESCYILNTEKCLSKNKRNIFGKPNKLGVRPIEMAAFMGKLNVFKLIYVKTSRKLLGLAVLKEGTKEIKNKCLNTIAKNGMNYCFGSGKTSAELDITVNLESDVLAAAKCGRKEDYLAIIEFLQQKERDINKFVDIQRKPLKHTE